MGMLEDSPIVTNEAEADALLSKIEGNDTPKETETVTEPIVETKQATAEQIQRFKLKYKGKEIEEPLDRVLSLAQQGYDYAQNQARIKAEQALIEKEKSKWKDIESRLNSYKEVEEYQKKDPNWWGHVVSEYQKTRQTNDPNSQVLEHPLVKELVQKVSTIEENLTTQAEREKLLQQAQQDQELDQEVTSVREAFPDFDWNTLDENGQNLERRILQHGINTSIASFRAAARDYLFDDIVKRHEIKAKESLGKQIQKTTRLGLGPVKDTPSSKVKSVQDVRSKSWDEIGEEAKRELRGLAN